MNKTNSRATTQVKLTVKAGTPAQQQAWRQLWRLLLTKDKALGKATNGKTEISQARL
jgi:hypothetical protein